MTKSFVGGKVKRINKTKLLKIEAELLNKGIRVSQQDIIDLIIELSDESQVIKKIQEVKA